MLSEIKQSSHGLLQGLANLLSRIVKIRDWGYIHSSKHQSSPFDLRYRTNACYWESAQNGETKVFDNTSQDAEALVVGLNMLLTSESRVSTFAIARAETVEKIDSAELRNEMLEAIDLLKKQFSLKQ